jgi:hypothetical protein
MMRFNDSGQGDIIGIIVGAVAAVFIVPLLSVMTLIMRLPSPSYSKLDIVF